MYMTSIADSLDGFLFRLASAESASQAWQEALGHFLPLGVTGLVNLRCAPRAGGCEGTPALLAEADPAVVEACAHPSPVPRDAVLAHLATALGPRVIAPLGPSRARSNHATGVLDAAAAAGYDGLMAVPVRYCSGTCVSGMVLLVKGDSVRLDALLEEGQVPLAFAAIQTHIRVAQLSGALPGNAPRLTRREREVLTLSAKGLTTRQVGEALGISISGVNFHLANAGKKLDANNRTHATSLAISAGLIAV
ncbi:helix-turn-helix transcriptional regulator [Roseospira navarrensis]|uniref:HTH luxR-type domain-containing protein n=1 Tax=Roseospira navarrensis TaxID=140058 RepID=A0A7X2D4K4_9PROT|nr:LuxR C-terminal-related transcriptional regulator [Roseospira navarrensis]MQX36295.1 hypothetical protein [Roseospira navarrensis]